MKLLVRSVGEWQRLVAPDWLFTAGVLGIVVGIEALGRISDTDLHDLLAAVTLVMLGIGIGLRHRRRRLGWVRALGRAAARFGSAARAWTFEIGLDLRGEPRVRRGSPPIILALAGVLAAWAIAATIFAGYLPHGLRAAVAPRFYLGYLLPMASVWLALMAMTLLAMFLPYALIHDAFVAAHSGPGPRPRRREFWTLCTYYCGLTILGAFLPVAASLLACAALLAVYLGACWLPHRTDVRFLWRPHQSIQVRSLSWGLWVTWEFTLIALALCALVLTACGDRAWGELPRPETMPVTAMLGLTLAWLAPGTLAALTVQMILGRLRDPARPDKPTAYLSGAAELGKALAAHGWRLRTTGRPGATDVPLVAVREKLATENDEPIWPLPVTPADADDPAFWQRIVRRDEILKRRKFLGALEGLFKRTVGRSKRAGSGYWVAPHFWFVGGLMRDSQRDADEELDLAEGSILSGTVGPPYHRVLPRGVRHHLYQMLRALEVDLIFVEDGVSFKRLRRVLRVLFEVFDVHGGRRAVQEVDFRGQPGTRVMIHDFQFDEPFKSETYPEPKYDYLGRARILHIFRDRGDSEELVEPPFDFTRRPAPAGAG